MEQEKLYVIEEKTYEAHIDEEVHLYGLLHQLAFLAGKIKDCRDMENLIDTARHYGDIADQMFDRWSIPGRYLVFGDKADQIAYINHDIDDAMRAGILTNADIPKEISAVLGTDHRDRINSLVTDMIFHSLDTGELGMTPEIERTMEALRNFMFDRVYKNPVAKGEEVKARRILQQLYEYYIKHPEAIPLDFQPQIDFEGMERVVCDYIAGMTDKYAMYKYDELFIPTAWQVRG